MTWLAALGHVLAATWRQWALGLLLLLVLRLRPWQWITARFSK